MQVASSGPEHGPAFWCPHKQRGSGRGRALQGRQQTSVSVHGGGPEAAAVPGFAILGSSQAVGFRRCIAWPGGAILAKTPGSPWVAAIVTATASFVSTPELPSARQLL